LPSQAAIRETIESIVIAFILAFLFRTFEAEAFVIPTGSMAPTLMGRHKDLNCPKCGYPYRVSASNEVTQDGTPLGNNELVEESTCPMCRYTADLGPSNPQHKSYPSYYGDRVLVGKCSYEIREPKRWDVIVFKYPGEASVNYIKRLIGLPGETVRIQHGSIWIRRGAEPFQIARKPPEKLLAMLQPVFDNDYMPKLASLGWPARWKPETTADASTAGTWHSEDAATFRSDGAATTPSWLRYHHLVPSYNQWKMVDYQQPTRPVAVKPQWITDFTAYNTGRSRAAAEEAARRGSPAPDLAVLGLHWAGDLALGCNVDAESDHGELLLEVRKGGREFQCHIDLATGRATLTISGAGMAQFRPAALTNVRGKGRHDLLFSNCDNELHLWVDGSVVTFDAPTTYADLDNAEPAESDLAAVGVASVGAAMKIGHLRILRDIYYIAVGEHSGGQLITDYENPDFSSGVTEFIGSHPHVRTVEFPLKADQFFMLGDNSAQSKDGRLWGPTYWVDRDLLIGKALCIYWPHSWNQIPTPWFAIPFPYFPNFQRMGLVR
jgi:signal peptidase I